METEKKEDGTPAEKKPTSPEERIARSLSGIKDALSIIVIVMLMGQCASSVGGKSDEAKAIDGVDYQLRQMNAHLSRINGTIENKSCTP